MPATLPALEFSERALLFTHLAAMEKAGLDSHHAFSLLELPRKFQSRIQRAQHFLKRGKDIATSGQISGLFTDLESQMIRAACQAGSPIKTYQRLAENYTARSMQVRAIKMRLRLPILILIIALFVKPLPQLISNQISVGAYLIGILLPIIILYGSFLALRMFWVMIEQGEASSIRDGVLRVVLSLPWLGKFQLRHDAKNFFESLGLLQEAGIPIFDALPLACKTVRNPLLREQYHEVRGELLAGESLYQALHKVPDLGSRDILTLINTAEHSGTLSETLLRYTERENQSLADTWKMITDWAPRLFYVIIAAWMIQSIFTSNAFMPNLPTELK
jgi:general secretion pathway protein F